MMGPNSSSCAGRRHPDSNTHRVRSYRITVQCELRLASTLAYSRSSLSPMTSAQASSSNPYPDFLLRREVWPKAHTVRLRDHYEPSSTEDLAAEKDIRSSHCPLGSSVTSSHRAAGTSGASYPNHSHPDDFEKQGLERALHEKHAGGWAKTLTDDQKAQLQQCIKDDGRRDDIRDDYKRLLDNPDIVISARTVHEMTPDFQSIESHQRMHGWARYILPVSRPFVFVVVRCRVFCQRLEKHTTDRYFLSTDIGGRAKESAMARQGRGQQGEAK